MKNKWFYVILICLLLFSLKMGRMEQSFPPPQPPSNVLSKVFQLEHSVIKAIFLSSHLTNIDPMLIAALAYTESEFKSKAISSKGYCSYMQIPYRIFDPELNFLIGAGILREKFTLAKGDTRKAIAMYKGYSLKSKKGREQVNKVLIIYDFLKGCVYHG